MYLIKEVAILSFLTFGDKNNKSLMMIHGMASTAMLCYGPLLKYLEDYYVILVEVDGHSDTNPGDFISLRRSCDKIEIYVKEELGGHLYALSGFSMGGTMAVELAGRGNIEIERLHLDAAFTVKMGVLKEPYKFAFSKGIRWIQSGRKIPKFLMDGMMGKDNNSTVEMLYQNVTQTTLKNACEDIYTYDIPDGLREFRGPALFWHGENEPYPVESAKMLKEYMPQMETEIFPGMGHGQFLHEHPEEYAEKLRKFLKD